MDTSEASPENTMNSPVMLKKGAFMQLVEQRRKEFTGSCRARRGVKPGSLATKKYLERRRPSRCLPQGRVPSKADHEEELDGEGEKDSTADTFLKENHRQRGLLRRHSRRKRKKKKNKKVRGTFACRSESVERERRTGAVIFGRTGRRLS